MSVDLHRTAFFDAAVEQYLLSTSDRVLGEVTRRRAGLSGETAVPIAVAVALLARARDDGHSALSLSDLATEATELARELATEVGADDCCAQIRERDAAWWRTMLEAVPSVVLPANSALASPLVLHGSMLQFRRYFDAEQRIAARIHASLSRSEPTFRVITGGPGTGKTTRIAALLVETLEREPELRVALAAPTGKAASRLSESIRLRLDAMEASPEVRARVPQDARTVHRLLGYQPDRDRFWSRAGTPLPYDLVILDEASMVDVLLMDALVAALPVHATLLLVGDQDQLASVEAGDVLGAICRVAQDLGVGNPLHDRVERLTRSYRFEAHPAIGNAAAAILAGDATALAAVVHDTERPDVRWAPAPHDRAELLSLLVPHVEACLAAATPAAALTALDGFRVLCAEREGTWGVSGINAEVERWLRSQGTVITERWYHRRPVMVMANDYGTQVFNGDVGVAWEDDGEMLVHFPAPEGVTRAIQPARLPETQTAWAMTVHKAQGSEFTNVIIMLPAKGSRVLGRELLYTAVTRARQQVLIVGDESVMRSAVSRTVRRGSGLEALLRQATCRESATHG
ncbi:exodeoxyribonuclease V subunit alpha [Gemmatimonas groenlandica]|uniref:Exodeoxyribonuclease V subunit alpha n=1 Tax=Gemmatimonas groenlandica TaxID=2732249 RepID=A0A6M4IR39_9BACT|nr:exodeoxyribonuclease V subunit alpha [Gemmatimonas groenlandica]QJR37394.1 exodeoxyribonuclease V subunit alpha [Gemmatimonas groenlandica]